MTITIVLFSFIGNKDFCKNSYGLLFIIFVMLVFGGFILEFTLQNHRGVIVVDSCKGPHVAIDGLMEDHWGSGKGAERRRRGV